MVRMMRAIDQKSPGGPETLFLNEYVQLPTLPDDAEYLLVRVHAFGLNRLDLLQREGKYPPPPGTTNILGVEFSGTVARPAAGFEEGEEVFGLAYGGAYAEFIAVSPKTVIRKPKELSWEQAAALPEVWFTALQVLFKVAEYKPGQSVLMHAGLSAVGIAVAQIVRSEGGKCYVTAGSKDKVEWAKKELGVVEGWNYKEENWEKGLLEVTGGEGVNVVIDPVIGGGYIEKDISVVARDGFIVVLATMGGAKDQVSLDKVLGKRITIRGTTLRSRTSEYQGEVAELFKQKVLPHVGEHGDFKIFIDAVFSWKDISKAHEHMHSNKSKGKIICIVD